ncbi:glycine N-methyltransferase [Rhinatrema bivittatum]|uniref:glycine N-methyltransferase n=1 Tax=Rhinatrema bivittatum TaxID=194408 RepID=UPI00112E6D63|nr:glycine N-methyltransferase [Rhinatrema bivittatum]
MVDSIYRTRSLGVAAEGLPDQYADGKAAKVWQLYIGDTRSRTDEYRTWLLRLLHQHSCRRVLDVACGTGVDSILLVEEGFTVTSVDASDKMLKYALKQRWDRRKEDAFDKWGKMSLSTDYYLPFSVSRLLTILILLLQSDLIKDISTSVLWVNNNPHMVTLDYTLQVPAEDQDGTIELSKFRLSYYPHRLDSFTELLKNAFEGKCEHSVYGDFQTYKPDQEQVPCYFIHVVKRIG